MRMNAKTKRGRWRRWAIAVLCTALLQVACGDDNDNAGTDTATDSDELGSGGQETDGTDDATDTGDTADSGTSSGPVGDVDLDYSYPSDADFQLVWKDDFGSWDMAKWGKASHSFAENEATFHYDNVVFEDGFMKLLLSKNDNPGAVKPYYGGELRTKEAFVYGRFETRARFAKGSGIISSLFTYYDHWADSSLEENWNELDIEFLGKDSDSIQYNEIVWNDQNQRVANEYHDHLAFDPSEAFHVYAFEWTPAGTKFYIDGELRHESDKYAAQMRLEQKIMMNIWPTNLSGWAGDIDETALPASAWYDWVKYSKYTGQ